MRVAIIGNSHFGQILFRNLSSYDKDNSYIFYNTSEKKFDKIKFFINLPFIDIVYSVGATIYGGGALNWALKFNKKIVQHFIGSDVLSAQEDFKNHNINKKLINQSRYLCEVNWIKDELKEIDIEADIKAIMIYDKFIEAQKFKDFSVLTYMGKGKEKFYGVEDFIKLAKAFPDIDFKIAGIDSFENLPLNIECLGWIDIIEELQQSTVFIRNALHDGLGFSVIESLSLGRITFYNYNFPHVNYFEDYNSLKNQFIKIVDDKKLKVNNESIAFVQENFNRENVLDNLIKAICD